MSADRAVGVEPGASAHRSGPGLRRSLLRFATWALVGCVPFWGAGLAFGKIPWLPQLPWAALGAVAPAAVAVVLARREGVLAELGAELRPRGRPGWWVAAVAVGLGPTLLDALRHGPWSPPSVPVLTALFGLYVLGALGEELGWAGFAQPRLLRLTGSVWASGVLLGAYWAAWHLVPYLLTGRPVEWVAWQTLQVVLFRCVIVGLAAGSGGGVWLAVLIHALSNLAWTALPSGGAAYDPAFVDAVLSPLAVLSLAGGARAWRQRQTRCPAAGAS